MTDGCVHLLYVTAPGPLNSNYQGNWYGIEKVDSTAGTARTKSHLPGHFPPASQTAAVLGPALQLSASLILPVTASASKGEWAGRSHFIFILRGDLNV
jgi:hypothetical protein